MTRYIRPIQLAPAVGMLVLALITTPHEVSAQLPDSLRGPPATVEEVVAQMRGGTVDWISPFLRQVRGARSPAELQAFSDSLVAFLQAPRPPGSTVHIHALGQISSAIASERGTPFVQGIDLFYRIYDSVEDPDVRASVLIRLASVSPPGRLLPVLTDALGSDDIRALTATRILAEEMGPAGARSLQDAYCGETIGSHAARSYLRTYFARGILDRECGLGRK